MGMILLTMMEYVLFLEGFVSLRSRKTENALIGILIGLRSWWALNVVRRSVISLE